MASGVVIYRGREAAIEVKIHHQSLTLATDTVTYTVRPLLSGHPRDFEKWPLNRGWPLNGGTI